MRTFSMEFDESELDLLRAALRGQLVLFKEILDVQPGLGVFAAGEIERITALLARVSGVNK